LLHFSKMAATSAPYSQSGGGSSGAQRHKYASLPVTILQLNTYTKDGRLFEQESPTYCLLGKIREIQKQPSSLEFVLDDSTGLIRCVWYQPTDTDWNVGSYIRVYGAYQNAEKISVWKCKPLITKNEITHHILAVIQAHRQLRGGAKPTNQNQPAAQKMEVESNNTNYGDALTTQIVNYLKANGTSEGVNVSQIIQSLGGPDKAADIRRALGQLEDSGAIFNGDTEDMICLSS